MKIAKEQLRQIIKEEISKILRENVQPVSYIAAAPPVKNIFGGDIITAEGRGTNFQAVQVDPNDKQWVVNLPGAVQKALKDPGNQGVYKIYVGKNQASGERYFITGVELQKQHKDS